MIYSGLRIIQDSSNLYSYSIIGVQILLLLNQVKWCFLYISLEGLIKYVGHAIKI